MEDFAYAHNDTSRGERSTATALFNTVRLDGDVAELRKSAFKRRIPTADDETLQFLLTVAAAVKPKRILEIGTATGISGAAMLRACPQAQLITIEREEALYREAQENFSALALSGRVHCLLGEAEDCLLKISGAFDLIFLDCAKVQYVKLLPRLKELLASGGTLFADDVLLYGWVTGGEPPKKRRMLIEHIREYIAAVTEDCGLATSIIDIGDGVALSVKLK